MKTHLELAERFIGAIERGDIDTVRDCYAPNAVIWHNFDGIEQTREQNLRTLGWLIKALPKRKYEVSRREILPDGFFQQHLLTGTTSAGQPFSMPACVICRIANGHITRLDEYLDPAPAAQLQRPAT